MIIQFLRQFKIGPFAIFDIVISYVGIYILSPLLIKIFKLIRINTNLSTWMWLTLPLSIVFHVIFNQNTPLTRMFLNTSDYWLVKSIIVIMFIFAFSSTRKANQND